jgi:imidazolonepropionase-like amidohydrolase
MWGILYHLRLKKEMETGFLIGPKLILATPKLTGPDDDGIDKIQLESPEEAIALLDKYKKKGYDVVKTCAGLPQPIYDAIVKKALVLGMPIAAHPGFEVPYAYHFKPGFESIEHTEEVVRQGLQNKLDSVKLDSVIALYLKSNIAHTPTLSIYQNIIDILSQGAAIKSSVDAGYMNPTFLRLGSAYDYNRWMTAQQKDPQTLERIKKQHEFHLYIVKKMHDAGVRLICGSNAGIMYAPAGFSTHEELGYYVQAGLTPYEALQTATANPSKASKYFANTGTILPGKKADLILSKNNPLHDLRTLQDPMAVWVGGVMIDSGRIDQFRQEAFQRKTGAVTLLRLLESLW